MAWKLHFVVCLSVILSAASAYKYPMRSQRFNSQPLFKTENDEDITFNPIVGNTNISNNRSKQGNKYKRQTTESMGRSENASTRVLQNFWKIIKNGYADKNPIMISRPTVTSRLEVTDWFNIPDHCKQSTYCEDVLGYPQDTINKLIKELGNKIHSLPLDKTDVSDTPDIKLRFGDGSPEDNVELCISRSKVVYPLAAKGPDGKWYTLINSKENPVQGFKGEICESIGSSCSDIVYVQRNYTQNGVQKMILGTACEQKYVPRTALVAEKIEEVIKMFEREVQMPSCCNCVIKTTKI